MSIDPTSDARSVIGTPSRRSYNFRRDGPARARGRRERGGSRDRIPDAAGQEGSLLPSRALPAPRAVRASPQAALDGLRERRLPPHGARLPRRPLHDRVPRLRGARGDRLAAAFRPGPRRLHLHRVVAGHGHAHDGASPLHRHERRDPDARMERRAAELLARGPDRGRGGVPHGLGLVAGRGRGPPPARPGLSGVEGAMGEKPKTAFELAMERLSAEDKESGTKKEAPLSAKQKEAIAEARRVASSRLAEREILFRDSMKRTPDPELRATAEGEYQIDRQRINDDC